jgi:Asp-tRNA(Asn)/Glu-tRNA(Gln) amidotransferase A subunit family amidase
VKRALGVVEQREGVLRAWAYLDAERALAEATDLDSRARAKGAGPLYGLVLAVKDIFDTGDQPTEYGSPIYAGFRSRGDASAVSLLRSASAVCLGKTATTEFPCFHPGPTTNPRRASHTPGGSSMGSAAAVAAGMCDLALGSQTAGSVVRPAAFCGVYGFKPSYGDVSTVGVKPVAPFLDTIGWFARSVAVIDAARQVLTGRPPAQPRQDPPTIGVLRTEQWEEASVDSQGAVEELADAASQAGARVVDLAMPSAWDGLAAAHPTVMKYEAARALAWELGHHRAELSAELVQLLEEGQTVDRADYDAIRRIAIIQHLESAAAFEGLDVLVTPATVGEAPEGLGSTGDPRFCRLWTLVGLPVLAVPSVLGSSSLPVAAQLIGRPGDDASVLWVARWLAEHGLPDKRAHPWLDLS